MALSQGARNRIKSFVHGAKKLLVNEFEGQLQHYHGIRSDGSYLMLEELTSKDASIIQTARLLRERLIYLGTTVAGDDKQQEAFDQLLREQAFTILNRFAAIRLAEERNIICESIRQGYNSEGFQVFDQLTGGASTADQFKRYNWYIHAIFDELAIDLPAVFDRFSPFGLLFPSEKVTLELLDIINDEELVIYREGGQQPVNLWKEDETIGWIYQYYNSREEIKAMREASGAPRNSRELAVRNQFFTPRYVVQFLVDNSLGRQWYEMTRGDTGISTICQYMVKQQDEVFLEKGEQSPGNKEENSQHIEYRELKDPREILMLDPACGSMHFGLYCFDLYEKIYIEAWDKYSELMPDLRDSYTREEFIKLIPGMIIGYNIHGVDIDPRAIQIAGLSLWLRAQKSYDGLGLLAKDRPTISKSNLVVAEPMPGDEEILIRFTKSLPGPMGKLVRVIWDKMKLAGETGLLLKIEEELKQEIEIAKQEWKEYKDTSAQTTFFDTPIESKAAKMATIYGKGQKITQDFFDTAEEGVLKALKSFSESAEGQGAYQKLLFAEDTARGFAFIELCRKRYDVIVMNPPFGVGSISTEDYYKTNYPNWGKNILCCFFSRMNNLLIDYGNIGAIFDRTVCIKKSYESFRINNLIGRIKWVADTGWGVLDANVETTAFVIGNPSTEFGCFYDVREANKRDLKLLANIKGNVCVVKNTSLFGNLPNSIIGYDYTELVVNAFNDFKSISKNELIFRVGVQLVSFRDFRCFWELNRISGSDRSKLYNGGSFSLFYAELFLIALVGAEYNRVKYHKSTVLRNLSFQNKIGVGCGKRGNIIDAHLLSDEFIFTHEGNSSTNNTVEQNLKLLSFLNSISAQYLINKYSGQHKSPGYLNILPIPPADDFRTEIILEIIELKKKWFKRDETLFDFAFEYDNSKGTINEHFESICADFEIDQNRYEDLLIRNDIFWSKKYSINALEEFDIIYQQRPRDLIYPVKNSLNNGDISFIGWIKEVLLIQVGSFFGRWGGNEIIQFVDDSTILAGLNKKLRYAYSDSNILDIVELEIEKPLGDYFKSDFFDYHLERYTRASRIAPIYWPISTKSNSFIVWIYYPALKENTLYKIVNELVDPKVEEVKKDVQNLETGGSVQALNDKKELLHELEEFKTELLRISNLPFKPNQDDGVLITAAPLHNLFRHGKWRKSTEDCWNKLEKGDYDWAHLAYSIWPDRVREKCKKDLSMAIAHGLEGICEVKPKEKKEKVAPKRQVVKQAVLL